MKKIIFILSIFISLTACDNDSQQAPQPKVEAIVIDSIQTYQGNFISAGNSAVLKGDKFIYQVKMDSIATGLKDDLKNYILKNRNMVLVEVEGKVIENPSPEGYSQMIEIKEINKVDAPRQPE